MCKQYYSPSLFTIYPFIYIEAPIFTYLYPFTTYLILPLLPERLFHYDPPVYFPTLPVGTHRLFLTVRLHFRSRFRDTVLSRAVLGPFWPPGTSTSSESSSDVPSISGLGHPGMYGVVPKTRVRHDLPYSNLPTETRVHTGWEGRYK